MRGLISHNHTKNRMTVYNLKYREKVFMKLSIYKQWSLTKKKKEIFYSTHFGSFVKTRVIPKPRIAIV